MEDNRETVPCEVCSIPTPMLGTKLCDRCWELKTRIIDSPEQAVKILVGLSTDTVKAVDMFGNDLTKTDSFGTPRKEPPDPWKEVHRIKLKHEAVVNAAQTVVNCASWQGEQAPQFLAEAISELKAALGQLHYTRPPSEDHRA